MSQHSDILQYEIAAGIQDGLTPARIVQRVQEILDVMGWDEHTVEGAPLDVLYTAKWMLTQKDGLYGVSHNALKVYITQLTKDYNPNPVELN